MEFYNFLCLKMTINSSRIYTKLNIPEECGNIIESDAFWIYVVLCRWWLWVSLVDQELLNLPEHPSSTLIFGGVHVTRFLVSYACFVDRCLTFCTFFWAVVFSVLRRYTDSDHPFGIFKLFLRNREWKQSKKTIKTYRVK